MVTGELDTARSTKPILMLKEQAQLILEICHFTQDLNPLWETRTTLKRLKSLSQPIVREVHDLESDEEKFEHLIQYFFKNLQFKQKDKDIDLMGCFLPQVLSSKQGPTPLLMLLFCTLCEEAGIRAQVTSCRRRYLLKVQLDGRAHIVDFGRACQKLAPYEIVELINRGFDFSAGCMQSDCLVVEYLSLFKTLSRQEHKLQILSIVHSYLMRYQPFNLKHLSERALVAYETGDYKTAVDDIRSYFQYKQPEFTNLNLKRIYKLALKRTRHSERQTPNTFGDSVERL